MCAAVVCVVVIVCVVVVAVCALPVYFAVIIVAVVVCVVAVVCVVVAVVVVVAAVVVAGIAVDFAADMRWDILYSAAFVVYIVSLALAAVSFDYYTTVAAADLGRRVLHPAI